MANVPEAVVVEVGANCTVTVQVPETARELAQVVDTKLKPEPVTDAAVGAVTASVPMPVLLSVAVAVLVVFTGVAGKLGVLKDAAWPWPVPVKAKPVAPVPLDVKLTAPARVPVALGVKVTAMEQVPLTARAVEHVLLCT